MSYKELYSFCQSQGLPVSRKVIRGKLFEITGRHIAITISSNLNPRDVRGMFLSVRSANPWVKQHGCDIVVLSRAIYRNTLGGNYCWDRFITVKEMMHVFDNAAEISDTGDKFDEILSSFFMTYDGSSPVVSSEIKGFWRALGALCPENKRQEFAHAVRSGSMTHYDVAFKLMIPEQYIGQLLSDKFDLILPEMME